MSGSVITFFKKYQDAASKAIGPGPAGLRSVSRLLVFRISVLLLVLWAAGTPTLADRSGSAVPINQIREISVRSKIEGKSDASSISGDGRYVAFVWFTTRHGKIGPERKSEVYLHDTTTGPARLVSQAPDGSPADGNSGTPVLNSDGRYLVFDSQASNLVSEDQNQQPDIFVYDRQEDRITLVSRASDGRQGNADSFDPWISGDGRYVVFASNATNLVKNDTNGHMDVFMHDRKEGSTIRISRVHGGMQPNGGSYSATVTAAGRYVTYESHASNLVPGDKNNSVDVFVYDRNTGQTRRASLSSDGTEGKGHSVGPFISGDGRFVTFQSYADDLVEGDTNGRADIFIRDLKAGVTSRVSVDSDEKQANAESYFPSISHDGRYVVFYSLAWNLVPEDRNGKSDIFVHDRLNGTTRGMSLAADGTQANGGSYSPMISGDGRYVTFTSNATNLSGPEESNRTSVYVVAIR